MPMKNPPHPGLSVRCDCLEPLGLSVAEAAQKLGVDDEGTIGCCEWSGWYLARDGDSPGQSLWWKCNHLVSDAGGLRLSTEARISSAFLKVN